MITWLHNVVQKTALLIITLLAPAAGLVVQPQTATVVPQQMAIVSESISLPPTLATLESSSSFDASSTDISSSSLPLELATITPNLLPKVKKLLVFKPPAKVATTTQAVKPKPFDAAQGKPAPAPTPTPTPPADVLPKNITADWLNTRTTMSFRQRRDGLYEMVFTTDLGNKKVLWGLGDATMGGNSSLPQFAVSYSCDPPPELPPPEDNNQSPFFKVATKYECDVSLAATTGNDRRAIPKHFSFKTDPGSVLVRPSSAMNSILRNDKNDGGFVFANRDVAPVQVTGITFAASLVGINTYENPLIVRFIDYYTGQTLSEYHLDDIPKGTLPYTQNKSGIELPLLFNLEPQSEKMLTVEVVGVRKYTISGVDPTISIVAESIRFDRSGVKTVMNSAQISWHCVVPTGQYDPNSTSSFAGGEVCKD